MLGLVAETIAPIRMKTKDGLQKTWQQRLKRKMLEKDQQHQAHPEARGCEKEVVTELGRPQRFLTSGKQQSLEGRRPRNRSCSS